jgi:hypothetical protein
MAEPAARLRLKATVGPDPRSELQSRFSLAGVRTATTQPHQAFVDWAVEMLSSAERRIAGLLNCESRGGLEVC